MSDTINYKINRVFNYNRYEKMINVGDLVKLSFCDRLDQNGESMWVEITEAKGYLKAETFPIGFSRDEASNTHFKGKLDNDPVSLDIKYGEIIEFDISHIITIWGV